jgi:hypothetical protein
LRVIAPVMQAGSIARIEKTVDVGAASLFALACGYAAYIWFSAAAAKPAAGAETAAAVALTFVLAYRVLRRVQPEAPKLLVPIFDVREVEPIEATELFLTERFEPPVSPCEDDALLLDDILAELGPDSRVVRLFDPAAMPTAGELQSRIDRHLDREDVEARTVDAAQALHDALAELRRSIR